MRKQNLRDGMILETRNGKRFLLTNDAMRSLDGFIHLTEYSEDLKDKSMKTYDIIKVYNVSDGLPLTYIFKDENLTLIWEREESKLTDREVEVLKALKTLGYNYIARGATGGLYGYEEKPIKIEWAWGLGCCFIPTKEAKKLFKFIKWTDKELTNIDDLLRGLI